MAVVVAIIMAKKRAMGMVAAADTTIKVAAVAGITDKLRALFTYNGEHNTYALIAALCSLLSF